MKKICVLVLAGIIALSAAGCSSGVSQSEYDKVVAERDALKSSAAVQSSVSSESAESPASSESSVSQAPVLAETKEPNISYKELAFYVPDSWGFSVDDGVLLYHCDSNNFLMIQILEKDSGTEYPLSEVLEGTILGYTQSGGTTVTGYKDTGKYKREMVGFEGEMETDRGTALIDFFLLQSDNYLYYVAFVSAEKNETFESAKEDIVNSFTEVQKETSPVQEEAASSQKAPDTSNVTVSQKNALSQANSYLRFTAFSYDGLIDQLKFGGFSQEDAAYAADNCGADWNEQALKKAKSYLAISGFSYSGLVNQLEFDQFTNEQATYGADNCGADWNEQAEKKAKSYLSFSSFSKDALVNQLEFEGFTHEQAVHGAEANGF